MLIRLSLVTITHYRRVVSIHQLPPITGLQISKSARIFSSCAEASSNDVLWWWRSGYAVTRQILLTPTGARRPPYR